MAIAERPIIPTTAWQGGREITKRRGRTTTHETRIHGPLGASAQRQWSCRKRGSVTQCAPGTLNRIGTRVEGKGKRGKREDD